MDFRTAPVRGEGACYEVTEVFAHALTTPRLVLEPVREGHADLVFAHASDARLWTYFPHLRPHTREDLRARYRRWERGLLGDARTQTWENWLCFQREGGAPIGSLQATILPDKTALLAYAIFVAYQRQGYAREAASAVLAHLREEHGVTRAIAEMDPRNAPSIALAKSLGFTRSRDGERTTDIAYELSLA
jgi:ribosomal-protein-alanine N-acetyltransferase